jgi:hypothetical protein
MFAFICYVSIHLETSARVVRSSPAEIPSESALHGLEVAESGRALLKKLKSQREYQRVGELINGWDDLLKPGLFPEVASLRIVVGIARHPEVTESRTSTVTSALSEFLLSPAEWPTQIVLLAPRAN